MSQDTSSKASAATGPGSASDDAELKSLIARTFDGAADSYDTIGPEYFARFGRRLVELAEVGPGMRVLDVGCGAGAALVAAGEAVGPQGHVLGIDIASRMLERSRAAVSRAGLRNTEVRSGDAEIPGVPPGDCDRVLAAQVLFFLPNLDRALRAYRHILRPGGMLAASSWGPDDKAWQPVYRAMFATIPDGAAPDVTPSGKVFRNDANIATAFEAAGFTDVRSTSETYDIVFDNADQWVVWSRSHGARAYWDAIPVEHRAHARAEALRAVGELAGADGRVPMPTTVRYTVATRP